MWGVIRGGAESWGVWRGAVEPVAAELADAVRGVFACELVAVPVMGVAVLNHRGLLALHAAGRLVNFDGCKGFLDFDGQSADKTLWGAV